MTDQERQAAGPGLTHGRGAKLGYRPALDGLRAVAVVAVMLYHGGVSWAGGGFLGVDVFFVLSGFLITSLLVQEWSRTGRIALRAFWWRRARRLLPAMMVVLVAVAGYALVASSSQPHLRGDSLATLGYVSNWWFIESGQSYFDQFMEPSPLRHTWSLAIEEQFYIAFPLLLVALFGRLRLGIQGVRLVLFSAALGSAALMAVLYEPLADPSRVYYGTDTRLQALLLGAVLALIPSVNFQGTPLYSQVRGRWVRLPGWGLLGWAALGGLLVMFTLARELAPWMYRGGFLLAAVLSGVLIAAVSKSPESALGRSLSWRPVVAIGVVSYGLYLWHWPVYVAVSHERTGLDGPALLALRFALTGLLAFLSFRFVEEPVRTRRLQRRITRTQWIRAVTAATAALVAVTIGATAPAERAGQTQDAVQAGRPAPVPDVDGRLVEAFLLGDSQTYALLSHYGNQVDGLAVGGSIQLGCGILLAERHVDGQTIPNSAACAQWEARWIQEVAVSRPDVVVLMLGLGELYDRRVGDEVVEFGTPRYRDWLLAEIDRRRELVRGHAGRFAVATVLCMRISADASDKTAQLANDPSRLAWLNATIRSYNATHPGVPLIDLYSTVCADGYTEEVDGVTLRDDGIHLNAAGAAIVWQRVGPQLIAAADGLASD